ncbi:hypothetical protein BGZ75_003385 [Mortierella antarctica]|nr:hypothetical protein BGZ75_003385 [Mortierella antarctica]
MATETVIYVSLALVLLTRIYVFISPPDFLEEHKDRRYHEYHLYRQYHLHKQYDDEPQENTKDRLAASSRRSSTAQQQLDGHGDKTNPMDILHHPSDELVLLGMGPGARPLPLHELSARAFSELDPLGIVTSRTRSSSSSTARENRGQQDTWGDADISTPNYLSLDTSEIHYNGSLKKFEQDSEVREAIRELQIGQRDLAKECPTMTVVWEGGRWCCLEGRTLYILRSLGWQGQVRVQVLVDKDATMLAVTEEYWRAAGMTSGLNPLATAISDPITPTPVSTLSPPSHQSELTAAPAAEQATRHQVNTSAATTSSPTVGLSLEETEEEPGIVGGAVETETVSRISVGLLVSGTKPFATTLEQDDTDGEIENMHEVESDGYVEDDEGDVDEEDDAEDEDDETLIGIEKQLRSASLQSSTDPYLRRRIFLDRTTRTATATGTQGAPPSPLLLPKTNESKTWSETRQHHERKISIPEFLLPPPLHDEQVYLIIDPASSPTSKTPPRRDSGHGNDS